MKIAIMSRGLVRHPGNSDIYSFNAGSVGWCKENLDILKATMPEHELVTYFCSWNSPNARAMSEYFDNNILLREPSRDECFEKLPIQPIWFSNPSHYCHGTSSLYKFFMQSRSLAAAIGPDIDYVIMTRPDLRIRINSIGDWINDDYNVPGMSYVNFNDHINIAPAGDMKKVWGTSENDLIDIVRKSLDTEDVVKNIVESNSIKHRSHLGISEYFIKDFNVVSFYNGGNYEKMKKELGVL